MNLDGGTSGVMGVSNQSYHAKTIVMDDLVSKTSYRPTMQEWNTGGDIYPIV